MDKIKDLELGEQVIGVSGIVLFLSSFFNWFSKDFGVVTLSESGWGNIWSLLAILIGIAMVAVLAIQNFTGAGLPDKLGTLSWAQAYLIAGAATLALVVLQLLVGASGGGGLGGVADLDPSFGLFIGLIAAAGLTAGGFLMVRGASEGETPGGPATPPTPPPPPQT